MISAADELFIEAFEACSIPKPEWTHQAHVHMAWIYLCLCDYETALERIRSGIQKYNRAVGGSPQGYHETVTQVYTRIVYHYMSREESWEEFAAGHSFLFDRAAPPALKYYRKETLSSDEARTRFVEPDLAPLPE